LERLLGGRHRSQNPRPTAMNERNFSFHNDLMDKPSNTLRWKLSLTAMVLKFLVGFPYIVLGALMGLFGVAIGPEGGIPISFMGRLAGLGLIVSGVAVQYPFSLVPYRGRVNWIVVLLTAFPLLSVLIGYLISRISGIPDPWIMVFILLLPVLSSIELLLSARACPLSESGDS
jgi:hypothetical protein